MTRETGYKISAALALLGALLALASLFLGAIEQAKINKENANSARHKVLTFEQLVGRQNCKVRDWDCMTGMDNF